MEATKFTEVGFHGRDVDQIIRDLMDNAVTMVRQRQRHTRKAEIEAAVEKRILDALYGAAAEARTRVSPSTAPALLCCCGAHAARRAWHPCSWMQAVSHVLLQLWNR